MLCYINITSVTNLSMCETRLCDLPPIYLSTIIKHSLSKSFLLIFSQSSNPVLICWPS